MQTWQTETSAVETLQILQYGTEQNGERARWGPGRRNFYILHYVLEGNGYFNGVPVGKGQGFLIEPMKSVVYHPDLTAPWKYFWVSFTGAEAARLCDQYIHADERRVFSYDFRPHLVEIMRKLQTQEKMIGKMYAISLFYQLMAFHEACYEPLQNRYVDEAVRFIHLNFHRKLTVREVGAACNVDDRYLYNLFVKHVGISPKQYLNEVRLYNAAVLLRESNCTITEAAFSVGFADVLTFSRFFAKATGMSPTAFRKSDRQFDFLLPAWYNITNKK